MSRKGPEFDFQQFCVRLSIPFPSPQVFKLACKDVRLRRLMGRIVNEAHPAYETDHKRKLIAWKKAERMQQLNKTLAEKEVELNIKEHDFEQVQKKLSILNCKVKAVQERTKELGKKTLLLSCKHNDLKEEYKSYQDMKEVNHFFQKPPSHLPPAKNMEAICRNKVDELMKLFHKYHETYVTNENVDEAVKTVTNFARHNMKDIPSAVVLQLLLKQRDDMNEELRSLIQSNSQEKSQSVMKMKERLTSEKENLMVKFLHTCKANNSLQQKLNHSETERRELIKKTVSMLQEKLCGYEAGDGLRETEVISKWVDNRVQLEELEVMRKSVKKLIASNTVKPASDKLKKQEDDIARYFSENGRLWKEISNLYTWFRNTVTLLEESEGKLQQDIANLKTAGVQNEVTTTLDILTENQRALEKELHLFAELPLDALYSMTLSSGTMVQSRQQILNYHRNVCNLAERHQLTDILGVLHGAPSTAPHAVLLHLVEKKQYLKFLRENSLQTNSLCSSVDELDVCSTRNLENLAVTSINELEKTVQIGVDRGRQIVESAEENYNFWVEQPLQKVVPDKMQVEDKTFLEWQCTYDALLEDLVALESVK